MGESEGLYHGGSWAVAVRPGGMKLWYEQFALNDVLQDHLLLCKWPQLCWELIVSVWLCRV